MIRNIGIEKSNICTFNSLNVYDYLDIIYVCRKLADFLIIRGLYEKESCCIYKWLE